MRSVFFLFVYQCFFIQLNFKSLDSLSRIEGIEMGLSALDEKAEELEEKKEEFKRKMKMIRGRGRGRGGEERGDRRYVG
ncbi:hypothetical protein AKJ61_02730 [candidate division MSBL1 archaeon SCGC-AAA259B11]|uniref:Uncharacterized protein n=1 Tax=candidate division MSBL1 archaeon SCGC-AAA259B11 TaxID=1698260 RepID=A0A133U5Q1_9EURY|nr:hypothetical protein AKJ61_02730 [candidate division MSBL1 archaeon SCGC-AAA259B11]